MPKSTITTASKQKQKAKQAKTSLPTPSNPTSSNGTGSAKNQVKLYSSFLPIPLILPSSVPIPSSSSSSKSTTSTKHYIYARPHTSSTTKSAETSSQLPNDRTLFATNLPIDLGIQDLRGVFGKWGIVEDVRFGSNEMNVLEQAVRGLPLDQEESDGEDEDEDEDEDEQEDDEEEQEEEEETKEPQFQGDLLVKLTKNQRRNQRKKAKNALPPSVPEIIELPSLTPRSTSFGISGSRSCHIIYLDPISISRLFATPKEIQPITINSSKGDEEPIGLGYYESLYSTLRPDWISVKSFADSSMSRFDHLHGLLLSSRAKAQGAGALVDEDGFTVVVRSGRYGRAGARGEGFGQGKGGVGVASRGFDKKLKDKKKGAGAGELKDFYKFQRNERKRQELADLREKFESDKQKVEDLKKSRRFKPY